MTLEQKIGQMLMFGWEGEDKLADTTASARARALVEDLHVGGIILFSRNIEQNDLSVTVGTINELQSLSKEPLLVNVDQEGGMVARFVDDVTVMPSNMALGATRQLGLAYKAAAVCAEELKALGVNYNFAPSVDVNNNPDNPIIGTRSYGESSDLVSEFCREAIHGYQDTGVIACAKHFPGHGDTTADSHLALPSVPYPRERLDAIELKPFKAAIEAGVSSIMTTHIMFPALDSDYPSTLSRRIITGLLRGEMGYDGVIATDSLEMKAIADNWGTPEACVLAIEAGVDIVLLTHTIESEYKARDLIVKAVKDGRISESRIDRSVERITALKQKYSLNERRYADPSNLGKVLRSKKHLAVQKEIAELSVTLARNENSVIPLRLNKDNSVCVLGTHDTVEPLAGEIRKHWDKVEAVRFEQGERSDIIQKAVEIASRADILIVPTCPHEPWKPPTDQQLQTDLVKTLNKLGKKLIVVAVREPYDLRKFPEVETYICTYGYRYGMLEAVAALVFGVIEPKGMLPVTIPL